ncbi:MAG: hypothetical protein ABW185_13915 [Sedimenticola sp.]
MTSGKIATTYILRGGHSDPSLVIAPKHGHSDPKQVNRPNLVSDQRPQKLNGAPKHWSLSRSLSNIENAQFKQSPTVD